MSFEDTLRAIVREVIREELAAAGGARTVEPEPDLVKLSEVRRWVQISKTTLKTWIKAGVLPKYGVGRIVRVKLADVRAVMQRKAVPPPRNEASSDVQRILRSLPGGG